MRYAPWPTFGLLLAALGVIAWFVWLGTRPPKEDFIGTFVVYTDAAIGGDRPEECVKYAGRRVSISDANGKIVWRGETDFLFGRVRVPALGCQLSFVTGPIEISPRYTVAIEGLGTHTYRLDVLREHLNFITWDSICVGEQKPCELDRQQAYYDS